MESHDEPMHLDPYLVIWADAHSDSTGWTGKREFHEEGEYLVHSIGWLIPTTDGGKEGHITLCQSYTPDEDVDHVLFIPQGMVRKISKIFSAENLISDTPSV